MAEEYEPMGTPEHDGVPVEVLPEDPEAIYVQSKYHIRNIMQSNVCLYKKTYKTRVLHRQKNNEIVFIKDTLVPEVGALVTRPPTVNGKTPAAELEGYDLTPVRVYILIPPERADWGGIKMLAVNNGMDHELGNGLVEHRPHSLFTEKLIAFLDNAIVARKGEYAAGGLWASKVDVSIVEWRQPSVSAQYTVSNQTYSASPSLLLDVQNQAKQMFGQEIATTSDVRFKKFLEMK